MPCKGNDSFFEKRKTLQIIKDDVDQMQTFCVFRTRVSHCH